MTDTMASTVNVEDVSVTQEQAATGSLPRSLSRAHTWVPPRHTTDQPHNVRFAVSMTTLTGSSDTLRNIGASSKERRYRILHDKTSFSPRDVRGDDIEGGVRFRRSHTHEQLMLYRYRSVHDYGYHGNSNAFNNYHPTQHPRSQTAPEPTWMVGDGRVPVLPPLGGNTKLPDDVTGIRHETLFGYGAMPLVIDDVALQRPGFKPRRVNVAVDRKVVHHLRRQLNRRLERRVNILLEEELEAGLAEEQLVHAENKPRHQTDSSSRPRRQLVDDLEHEDQNEADPELEHNPESTTPYIASLPSIGGSPGSLHDTAKESTEGHSAVSGVSHLPKIHNEELVTGNEDSGSGFSGDVEDEYEALEDETVDPEIEKILSNKATPEEPEVEIPEQEVFVSPVPTPYMFRPETRDQSRLTLEEKVKRILEGSVNISFTPDNKTVTVFLSGGCTDSDAERSMLIQRVLPDLHAFASSRAYSLRVLDPHWGVRHLVTDAHTQVDLVTGLIEAAQENSKGINFVTFLGQKYGDPVLPATIDQHDFVVIRKALEVDYVLEVQAATVAATAAEEKKRLEEEQKKHYSDSTKKDHRVPYLDDQDDDLEEEDDEDYGEGDEQEDGFNEDLPMWEEVVATDSKQAMTRERSVSFDSALDPQNVRPEQQRKMSLNLRKARPLRQRMAAMKTAARNAGKEVMTTKAFQGEESGATSTGSAELVDPGLLKSWYKLDNNVVPAVYRLQNISSHFKDFLRNDVKKRQVAHQQFLEVAMKLQRMLSTYAERLLDAHAARKYNTSLLELELQHGVLWSLQDPKEHAFWFRRDIEDLSNHISDELSPDYTDINPLTGQPELRLSHAITELRYSKMERALPKERIWKYPVNWSNQGVTLSSTRSHGIYLDRMCKEFRNVLTSSMTEVFARDATRPDMTSELFREVIQHVRLCQQRARTFHGRKHLLQMVKAYIRASQRRPLVVHGGTGSGTTSLLAKAAKDTAKWLKGSCRCSPVVIFRSVGVTPASSNLRLMLRDICRQLTEAYSQGAAVTLNDHQGLVNDFNFRLTMASATCPLIVYINGVNLLLNENDAHKMNWLPMELPPHVRLIISTLSDNECLPALQTKFKDTPEAFLEVPSLPVADAVTILEHWFNAEGRAVTQEQFDVLIESFKLCTVPLYLRLIYLEALRWPSYLPVAEIKLLTTVKKMAVNVFGRLEKDHGEPLVRRALGYITASRNGVTESEMEDLLSLDDIVLDDIFLHTKASLRRLPQVSWLQLCKDLENYLIFTVTDNTVTLRWFHDQFSNAATDRYLNQRDKAPSYHKAMADYFMDKWSTKPKPSPKAGASLRHVMPQPLFYESTDDAQKTYNLRRLMELPFHLLHAQQMDALKLHCLCNFDFLRSKLSATSLRAVFDDIRMALQSEPADGSLLMLSDALLLSANVLNVDASQLASQLVGRLHSIVTLDVPVAPADPVNYPFLKPLFKQIMHSTEPALIPSTTCLTPPDGILFDLLYGHNAPITAVVSTADGQRAVTTSRDDTLKLWELRTGQVIQTICGVGANVFSIRLTSGNHLVVTSEVARIRIWNLGSGILLRDIKQYDDPANLTIATEANLLAAFYDGCRKLRVFNLAMKKVPLTIEVDLSGENNIHKDNSSLVSLSTNGVQVLYAFRSGSFAYVRNIKSGKRIHAFEFIGSASAVATSKEYFIVAVRLQYMKLHEISQLELFDLRSGKFIRMVRGCPLDNIRELHINQLGSHAIVVSSSETSNTSDIVVWNIETEEHKHLAKHSTVSKFGACVNLRFCLTASPNENSLRIWNLSSKMNVPAPRIKQQEGLEKLIAISKHSKYIIAKSFMNGPLTVWNVAKKKFAGMVVQSMSGVMDVNDIMVVKDTKLVILTEKGFSNVSAIIRPVYQTIILYDILQGKFTKKITGCYIVPCQSHEYIVLDDDHLLGLADTRGHFVVWSLKTGHVAYRIKANFKNDDSEDEDDEYGSKRRRDSPIKQKRNTTAKMAPWDRRAETHTARERRHVAEDEKERARLDGIRKEKDNGIEQFIVSKDLSTIVASYYGHHLCIFDIPSQSHKTTLESEHSMLLLHVAALTDNGSHVVHANYDEETKTSYVTLWDCKNGTVKRRLRNEKNVCCIAISDKAKCIVFGKSNKELRIWDPLHSGATYRIRGYAQLDFKIGSQLHMLAGGRQVVAFTGDISIWDLECRSLLSVFTPDMTIQSFTVAMNGQMLAFGLKDRSDLVTLRLLGTEDGNRISRTTQGDNLFGEVDSSSDDDSDEEEKEESDGDN